MGGKGISKTEEEYFHVVFFFEFLANVVTHRIRNLLSFDEEVIIAVLVDHFLDLVFGGTDDVGVVIIDVGVVVVQISQELVLDPVHDVHIQGNVSWVQSLPNDRRTVS